GPTPAQGTPERARWEDTAGQIKAWRQLHDYSDEQRALPEPTEVPAHDRADLEQLRSRLAPAPGAPAKSRGAPLPSLKERVAAQRAAEGTSRLSEGQKRADDQMRQRLAQQARDREQGKGPVQR